jgi:hypothetical protein
MGTDQFIRFRVIPFPCPFMLFPFLVKTPFLHLFIGNELNGTIADANEGKGGAAEQTRPAFRSDNF